MSPEHNTRDTANAVTVTYDAGYDVLTNDRGGRCETTDAWEPGRTVHVVTVHADVRTE